MLLWQVPTKELTTLLFQYEGLGKYSTQNDKWKMVSQLPQGVWTVCTKQSSSLLQWHSYLLPPYKIDKNPVCHIDLIKKCMFTSELPIFHNFLVPGKEMLNSGVVKWRWIWAFKTNLNLHHTFFLDENICVGTVVISKIVTL